MTLAAYACDPLATRGRLHAEVDAPTRNPFQRDRDRVIHSSAFRRLVYKTQVFINHEGDLFRTRLTHSLEVAQLARSMARSLDLNEDLVEAIALAHDLGHTPFGHVGQAVLHRCLQALPGVDGSAPEGFEHNWQSLRVVDRLEQKYPHHDGLNLCFETREGILKHCSGERALALEQQEPGGVGARFLNGSQPSLEAQLCNVADQVAYNAHDVDDGVRSGLLTMEQLSQVPWLGRLLSEIDTQYPALDERRRLYALTRRMLSDCVYDVMDATRARLASVRPQSVDAARHCGQELVGFSASMREDTRHLKAFLFKNLYRHAQVTASMDRARQVMEGLFAVYVAAPGEVPQRYRLGVNHPRAVADYMAGMTDRFAIREHERLTGARLFAPQA
jgi:dGTPase